MRSYLLLNCKAMFFSWKEKNEMTLSISLASHASFNYGSISIAKGPEFRPQVSKGVAENYVRPNSVFVTFAEKFSGKNNNFIIRNSVRPIFFLQQCNFSSDLAEIFCQELATLSSI
jgi:hypothetical protein